jgi:hypothetical protein
LKKKRNIKSEVSIEVDKLTNSIEDIGTGKVHDTEFHRLTDMDKRQIKKKEWFYNWQDEIGYNKREVYKLTIKGDADIIQGLISISLESDHVFVHFVESSDFNQGEGKAYNGVAGNMFAFACKRSKEEGLNGFIGFRAKTNLIEHYKKTLGAMQIKNERMYIDDIHANKLIKQYFKS